MTQLTDSEINMLAAYMVPEEQRAAQLRIRQQHVDQLRIRQQRQQRQRPRPNFPVNRPREPLQFDGGGPGAPPRPHGGSRLAQKYKK